MDQTQFGSIQIAIHKAEAAALFRRPTKAFEDWIAQGGAGIAVMTLDGIIASEVAFRYVGRKDHRRDRLQRRDREQDGIACKAGADTIE